MSHVHLGAPSITCVGQAAFPTIGLAAPKKHSGSLPAQRGASVIKVKLLLWADELPWSWIAQLNLCRENLLLASLETDHEMGTYCSYTIAQSNILPGALTIFINSC